MRFDPIGIALDWVVLPSLFIVPGLPGQEAAVASEVEILVGEFLPSVARGKARAHVSLTSSRA